MTQQITIKKKTMERTFEEILKDKLTTPVAIKGRTETILPMEAMEDRFE